MKRVMAILVSLVLFYLPQQAHAQSNFSVGAALTSTFSGIGLGVDVGLGDKSQAVRFGVWVNIPSAALQTNNFGIGAKIALLSYDLFDFLGLPIGGYGDIFAFYTGVYAALGIGGNAGFFVGVGALLGLEVNPIPNFLGAYAEFGLGLGIPFIVDANLTIGLRIFLGNVFG